jgi:hypothetical protein
VNLAGAQREAPQRRCVGCRQSAADSELVRFVTADGVLRVDVSRRLPGRGAWVHPRRGCLQRGLQRGGFAHALQTAVRAELGPVLDELRQQLEREALSRLGLIRRSGALAFGRDAAAQAVQQGKARALWLTTDAAPRTAREVARVAQEHGLPLVTVGGREAAGQALGTAPLAVVALPPGPAGERACVALQRWAELSQELDKVDEGPSRRAGKGRQGQA